MTRAAWITLGGVAVLLVAVWLWVRDQGKAILTPELDEGVPTVTLVGDAPPPPEIQVDFNPEVAAAGRVAIQPLALVGTAV